MNLRRDLLSLLKETYSEFQADEASTLGAALAYYALFSMFPLLLLLIAGLGYVLQYWDQAINVQDEILAAAARNWFSVIPPLTFASPASAIEFFGSISSARR